MKPILVGGCGRSGTTMLGAMLGAHTECLTVPESSFMIDLLRRFDRPGSDVRFPEMLDVLAGTKKFKLWGLNSGLNPVREGELGGSYAEFIEWMVRNYARQQGRTRPGYWVDHTPTNVNWASLLFDLFPQARLIHIVRDGRAVASSVMALDWGPNTVMDAARWWTGNVANGLAAESCWGRERVRRVRYEDLVQHPARMLEDLCDFLDIEYQAEMVDVDGFKVPGYWASTHALVGKTPQLERIRAWERELTSRQVEIFEHLTCELLCYLGYELMHGLRSEAPTRSERLAWFLYDLGRRAQNRVRRHWRDRLIPSA